jgi:hypothetical protein
MKATFWGPWQWKMPEGAVWIKEGDQVTRKVRKFFVKIGKRENKIVLPSCNWRKWKY